MAPGYVFPAGRRNVIEDGALLLWHGSTNNKRSRSLIEAYEAALLRQMFNESDADDDVLVKNQSSLYQLFALQIKQEAGYFARIGVDPSLCNMGAEPDSFDALWTVSLETMRAFGITDVMGPDGYGSPSYLAHWRERYKPAVAVLRLKKNPDGKVAIDW